MSKARGKTPRTEIIAEVANAHQGVPSLASEIAQRAYSAGADAVKFQLYSGPELLTRNHPRYDHFVRQSFTEEQWSDVIEPLVKSGLNVYCDVFGETSLNLASNFDVCGVKIHSSDLLNVPLLEKAAALGKSLLIGIGGSTPTEINNALAICENANIRPVLLHGYQAYPTLAEDSHLNRINWLKQYLPLADIGFMDHISGDDPFAVVAPCMAIALGATVVEKHVTINRAAKGVDYFSSLEVPHDFGTFVTNIRSAEASLGITDPVLSPSELKYRQEVKKHWVANRDLHSGNVLGSDDLTMKRTITNGLEPINLNSLVEHQLLSDVGKDSLITRDQISTTTWGLVIARMASSRLPGKALINIAGTPALGHLFERLKRSHKIHKIVLCTTLLPDDDELERLAQDHSVECYRGEDLDVLARMLGAVNGSQVDAVVRVTGDDILVDPDYLDKAISHHYQTHAEYTSLKSLPSGTEAEIFDTDLLRRISRAANDTNGTEYLTTFISDNHRYIRCEEVDVNDRHCRDWRLTLDTPEDLELIRKVISGLAEKGLGLTYSVSDIVDLVESDPDLLKINADVRQRSTPTNVDTSLNMLRFF